MLKFLKGLLALLLAPFDLFMSLFRSGSAGGAAVGQEHQEREDRAAKLARTEADGAALGQALDVRAAALRLVRGETLDRTTERPVRWWLESLSSDDLRAVAGAKPEMLSRLLSGASVTGLPAFERAAWDGSAILASFHRDRRARLAAGDACEPEPVRTPEERRASFRAAVAAFRAEHAPASTPAP